MIVVCRQLEYSLMFLVSSLLVILSLYRVVLHVIVISLKTKRFFAFTRIVSTIHMVSEQLSQSKKRLLPCSYRRIGKVASLFIHSRL